jgi:ferric-dicitrate binding protein FerR (iron transport regulator)
MDLASDILLARYLDGTASPEELAELDRRLINDPATARQLLGAAGDDLAIRRALSAKAAALPSAVDVSTAAPRPVRRGWFIGPRVAWAAAAAVMLLAGSWYVATRSSEPAPTLVVDPSTAKSVDPSPVRVATLTSVGTGVTVERNGRTEVIPAGGVLTASDRIRTGATDGTQFAFADDGTSVRVQPSSTVGVSLEAAGGKRLDLAAGAVTCDVARQQPGKPLVVQASSAQVVVVGTKFTVRTAGQLSQIEVEHGTVRVTRLGDGASVDVSAGEFVVVGKTPGPASAAAIAAAGFPQVRGKDMGPYWSTRVKPAGIDH